MAKAGLREKLLKKNDYKCVSCGTHNDNIPLQIAHLIPISEGGDDTEENFTVLCPNCHFNFDREPRENEFVMFLSDILYHHPDFSDVGSNVVIGNNTKYRADLLVLQAKDKSPAKLLIECKTHRALSSANVHRVIAQLKKYQLESPETSLVLAVPATLNEREISLLNSEGVKLWDLQYIAGKFSEQIPKARPGYFKTLFVTQKNRAKEETREAELIKALISCKPGKKEWAVYQSLVGDILEHLFTPPLEKPIPELSDSTKTNRRDFILPNYTEKGFWSFIRLKYQADYVIVDAKNLTGKVKKKEVLQIANYLKPHGAGLFALIFSRHGGDKAGCENTLREQWLIHKKLILILNDDDLKEMLTARLDGRPPEDTIGRKIEKFRLSM